MAEATQVKKLSGKEDLARLVAGDIVEFGIWKEKCLVYDYPNLAKEELFLISRLETTGVKGTIGIIFGDVTNNLYVKEGTVRHEPMKTAEPRKTPDELFHYGVNLFEPEKGMEKYRELEAALKAAGL